MIQSSCGGTASSLFGAQAARSADRTNKLQAGSRFMPGDSTMAILFGHGGRYF
jgi:hypothetical protein